MSNHWLETFKKADFNIIYGYAVSRKVSLRANFVTDKYEICLYDGESILPNMTIGFADIKEMCDGLSKRNVELGDVTFHYMEMTRAKQRPS